MKLSRIWLNMNTYYIIIGHVYFVPNYKSSFLELEGVFYKNN